MYVRVNQNIGFIKLISLNTVKPLKQFKFNAKYSNIRYIITGAIKNECVKFLKTTSNIFDNLI